MHPNFLQTTLRVFFACTLLCSSLSTITAQCTFNNFLNSTVTLSGSTTSNVACVNGGQYVSIAVTSGETYNITTCGSTNGGDSQITLFNSTNTAIDVGFNDDDCGLLSTVSYTATFTGTLYIQVNDYNCITGTSCYSLDITCTSCSTSGGAGCSYQLDMFDSFGDGWDGSTVDVSINGTLLGSYTVTGTSNSITFNTNDCDIITLSFTSGALATFDSDVSYTLYELPDLITPVFSIDYGTLATIPTGPVFYTTCGTGCSGPSVNNVSCDSMAPICTTTGTIFSASTSGVDANTAFPGPDYGCLSNLALPTPGSAPDPTFWYLEISQSGNIDMSLFGTVDVDFIIWGPYSSLAAAQSSCGNMGNAPTATNGAIVDCSYDGTNSETPSIPAAVAGEVYIMMITNFAGVAQNVSLTQTGGTGATDCSIVTACNADAGTQTITINGNPTIPGNPLVLCWGDCLDITTDSNFVLPTPVVGEEAELMYAVYTGAPNPSITDPANDPNYSGSLWTGDSFADCNDPTGILSGAGLGSQVWLVPITMDDGDNNANPNGVINWDNDGDSCYALGTPIEIVLLDSITATITDNCQSIVFTLAGGYPGFNPGMGTYTVANTGPGTMTQSGTSGEIITFTGFTPGQTVSFDVSNDGNSCFNSFSHTTNIPPSITLDNIVNSSCTTNDGAVNLTVPLTPCTFTIDMFDTFGDGWNGGQLDVTVGGLPATGSPFTFTAGFSATASFTVLPGQAVTFTYVSGAWDSEVSYNIYQDGNLVFSDGTTPLVGLAFSTSCPAYIYQWSTGATTEDLTNVGAGSYTLTVTDNNGCTATSGPHTVVQANAPVITLSSIDSASCNGANDGAVNITATGGTGTLSYNWTGGQTTQNATGLAAGSYTVTVTDANGCSATSGPHVVIEPTVITVTLDSIDPISCNSANDGAVNITATGGTGTLSYNWTGGQTTQNATGLAANNYTVTVTDANGCSATSGPHVVTEPTAIMITLDSIDLVSCNSANDGAVNITATGGTGTLSYNWTGGQTTQNATGLAANNYTVTVTDANGCSATSGPHVVTEPTVLVVTIDSTDDASCSGMSDGAAYISVTGGTLNYNYNWSSGQTIEDVTGLTNGSYILTVTDANGCTMTVNPIISVPSPISISLTPIDPLCNGDATGCIGATVTGGNGNFGYNWSNGSTLDSICGLMAGTYTLTITDTSSTGGGSGPVLLYSEDFDAAIQTWAINQSSGSNPSPATNNIWSITDFEGGVAPNTCGIASNGNNTMHVTCQSGAFCSAGGASGAAYNAAVESNYRSESPSFSSVGYTGITVEFDFIGSGDGLLDNASLLYNDGLGGGWQVVPLANTLKSSCCSILGGTVPCTDIFAGQGFWEHRIYTLPASCDNNPNLQIAFNWTNNADNIGDDPSFAVDNIVVMSTTSTGGSATVCTATNSVTLNNPPALNITLNSIDSISCNGGSDGAVNITATGGTGTLSYNWTGGQTTQNATGLAAGSYTVTVTDTNGCSTTSGPHAVSEPTAISITLDSIDAISCNGANDGAVNITATGGTGTLSYNWTGGQTTQNATGLAAGSYTVTVTDANGCSTTSGPHVVNEPTAISITLDSIDAISCNGANDGAVNITATGGTGTLSYNWTGGQTTQNATGLAAGSYTVTVTDANGCSTTSGPHVVNEPTAISITLDSIDAISCNGANDGAVNITATGGTGTLNYNWTGGQTTQNATGLTASSYTVTVTDANGCSTTSGPHAVSEPTAITVALDSIDAISCNGANDGAVNITATGGTGTLSYNWTGGQTTQNATGLAAGSYTVTVTDANGCSTTSGPHVVNEPTAITVALDSIDPISCNGANDGAVNITATGGTGTLSYNWTGGQTTQNATGLAAGSYTVTVTDANGCSTTSGPHVVNEPTAISIAQDSTTSPSCNGTSDGAIYISVTGGTTSYRFVWSAAGQTTEDLVGIASGTYTVTVTDANNCEQTFTTSINQPGAVGLSLDASSNVDCAGNNNGSISITASGGSTGYSFIWSNNSTTEDLTGLSGGTYVVTVTDANNCTDTLSTVITEPTALVATLDSTHNVSCGGSSDGAAFTSVTGGTGSYSFLWSNSSTTEDINSLAVGAYTLVVSDQNSCTDTVSTTVGSASGITIVDTVNNASCNGANDGSINLTVSGGTSGYSYLWSNAGETTQNITGISAGSYSVTVTDGAGCAIPYTPNTITEPAAISISLVSSTDPSCSGNDGSIDINVTGGSGGYTYAWSNSVSSQDLTNLGGGTYTVTVTDANSCSNTSSATLSTATGLTLQVNTITGILACDLASIGELQAVPSTTDTAITYLWSNGDTTATADGLAAGAYTVTATTSTGCTATASGTIEAPVVPTLNAFVTNIGTTDTIVTWNDEISLNAGNDQTAQGVSYAWTFTGPTNGDAGITNSNAPSTTALPTEDGVYDLVITATATTSGVVCTAQDNLKVTVKAKFQGVPNAFTPNDNGENDLFRPIGLESDDIIEFKVFNRWGQVMYNGDDLAGGGWDGTHNGADQPRDVYVYVLRFQQTGDEKETLMRGSVTLMR